MDELPFRREPMNTKVKELSLEELKAFINETVDMRLEERLGDPDVGLDVKPEVIEAIRKSRRSKITIPAEEAAKRLGLKW
jgi:signal recognition particle GTPase